MLHHASTDHVEVNVDNAAREMLANFDRSGVVAILATVVGLGGTPGDQLYAASDLAAPLVAHQQMDVVGGDRVAQDAQTE